MEIENPANMLNLTQGKAVANKEITFETTSNNKGKIFRINMLSLLDACCTFFRCLV